jgi:hypothetical protein
VDHDGALGMPLSEIRRWVNNCPNLALLHLKAISARVSDDGINAIDLDDEVSEFVLRLDVSYGWLSDPQESAFWAAWKGRVRCVEIINRTPAEQEVANEFYIWPLTPLSHLRTVTLHGAQRCFDTMISNIPEACPQLEQLKCPLPSDLCGPLVYSHLHELALVMFNDYRNSSLPYVDRNLQNLKIDILAGRLPKLTTLKLYGPKVSHIKRWCYGTDVDPASAPKNIILGAVRSENRVYLDAEARVNAVRLNELCSQRGIDLTVYDIDVRPEPRWPA